MAGVLAEVRVLRGGRSGWSRADKSETMAIGVLSRRKQLLEMAMNGEDAVKHCARPWRKAAVGTIRNGEGRSGGRRRMVVIIKARGGSEGREG